MFIPEQIKFVPGLSNTQASVGDSADRVSLENYEGVIIFVVQRQGGGTADTLTYHKATAASGGTEDTANAIPNWWYCLDVTAGTTADTWTKGTAVASGSTISTSAAAAGTSYYLIDIKAADLPEDGYDYKFVEAVVGSSGNAANYIDVHYLLYGPRYGQASLPSAQA